MALASEKELQIDKFLNRKSSMEPQKTFDLTQWEREFREEANSDDVGEIIDCIRRFIESMIIYVLNENYQRQTLLARKCFIMLNSVLQDILKKNLRNEFVKNVTELIFDIIIEENADYWCIKKELLKKFNSWVSQTSHDIKLQIVTGLSQMYLCKMVDNLTSYGDYELQLTIIEAIFRLYGKTEINKRLKDLIPESEELSQTFADINPSTFDEDCRLFLNNINQKHEKIFSIICDSVLVGNTVCEQPTTDINGLWVDFNICDKAVSWHYRRTAGSNETFWELITLFVSELEHFEIKSTPDMYCIQFIMSGHLITSSEEDSSFLHQSKNVIIILKRNEKAEQLVTSILPKLLDQPPPNPTKKCSRAKMAYKSLDVKVSKSANKSMLSKSEVSSMYNPLQPMPHTSNESKSVNSSKDRSANLGLIKVTSESEDEVISIASTDGSNTYLSVEDTSLIVNSQRTQILSGKCTTSDFNYRQIISSQSASQDNYLTAEGYVENSIKVSTYKNHGTNNSFTDKFKTAEEGSSENYKVQKLSSAKILKVSNKSNLNKKISNREIIEDLNSMKVNIHEYDLTEKENLIKVSQAKYKEESKPKISRNINISQKHAEEINQIRNLDDSMDFAERIICSSEVILKSDQKTSLNNILTQEVDATENTKSNLKHRKEDLSVPQDETVKNTSNWGIVTEENSSQIEILESKKEITKTPKISKKISQQKIKSAEERQIYNEIVEREQIDVIQKVSKFKNKISIVGHMTETNAFLREGSSKSYKNQSKRVNLVDGTAKKETFLEDVGQQKIIQRTLNTAKKISKSEIPETKLAKDAETFKPGESFSNLKQTVESKTKSEQEEKICLKVLEENILPKPVDNILQEKIERQRTMYPKRRTLESRNFIEEKTRTTKSEKSYKRRISTDEELNGVKDITKNTEIIYTEEPVMLSAEDGDEAKHKETEKNRRRYSKRSTIISTTKKITSDDEQLSDAGNIIKDTETTDIKERVIYVGDSDEEKPKETIDKKRRYSMQPTILPSDDDSHKEEPKETENSKRRYSKRPSILPPDEDLMIKDTETTDIKEPVIFVGDGDEEKSKKSDYKKRRYSKQPIIITTAEKVKSDDEDLSGAEDLIKNNKTHVGYGDKEEPMKTDKKRKYSKQPTIASPTKKITSDDKDWKTTDIKEQRNKRRYSKRPTILLDDEYLSGAKDIIKHTETADIKEHIISDHSHKEKPKETKKNKRGYFKRSTILPSDDEDLNDAEDIIKDTETADIKEPVISVEDGDEEKAKKIDDKKRRYSKQPIIIPTAEKVKSDDEDLSGTEDLIKNNKTHVGYGDKEEPMKTDKKRIYSKRPTIAPTTKKITSDDEEWKTTGIKEQRNKRKYSKRPTILLDDEYLSDAKDIIKNTETADMKERVISVCGDETDDKDIIKHTETADSKEHIISDRSHKEKPKETKKNKRGYFKRSTILPSDDEDLSVAEDIIKDTETADIKEPVISVGDGDEEKSKKTDDKKQRFFKQLTMIPTSKKVKSDDEDLSGAEDLTKNNKTTNIKYGDEEEPKETEKKSRYSKRLTTTLPTKKIASVDKEWKSTDIKEHILSDHDYEENPKKNEKSKRRYSKRSTILPSEVEDIETADMKEPVISVGHSDEKKPKETDDKKGRYAKQPTIIPTAKKVKTDDEDLSGTEDLTKNKTHVGYGDVKEPMKTDKKRRYSKRPTITPPNKNITPDDEEWKATDFKEQRNKRRYSKRPTILLDDEDLSDAKDIIKNTETADMKERVISVCGDETDDKNRRYPKRQIIKPITKINASDDKELSDPEDVEKHKEAEEKKGRYPKRRRTITLAMEKNISVNELNNEENKKEISAEDSILAKDQITQIREGNKEKNKQEYESTIEESRNLDDKKQRYSKKQSVSKKNEGYVVEKPKRDSEIINTEHIESNEGHKIKVKKSIKNKKYEKESSFKESYEGSKTKDKDENNREHVMQGPKKYEDVNIEESKNVPENIDAKKWASNSDFKNKSTDNILATVLVSNINDTVENVESPILSQHLSSARCVSTTPKYNSESENINNSKKLSEKIKTAHPYSTPTSEEQLNLKVTTLTDALDNGITLSQLEAYEVPTQKNTPSVMEKSNKFQQRYIKIGNNLSDTSEEYVPLNSEIQPIIDSEKKFDNLAKQNFSEGILPIEQMNKKTDESKNDTITKSEDRIHLTPSPDKRDVDVKSHRNDFGKESQLSSSVKITSSHEKQFAQYQSQNQIKDQHENVIGDITIHPSLLSKGSVQKMVDTPLKTNGQEHLTEKVKVVQFDVKSNSNSSITTRDLNQTISTSFSARKRKLYYPDEMIVINMEDSLLEVKKPKKIIKEIQKDVSDTTIFTKRKFRTEQSEKPTKNTTKDLETISKAKSDEPKTTSCIKNNIMDEIEKHFSADVQDPKRGAVKKEGRENAQSKSFNFKINSTKRTSIGRKNVTTIGVVLDEEKQFNKTMHKRKKLNTTISSNNSMVKLKSHFERMLDSWRQDASKGSSLIDYLNDNRGKEKKGKTKISEKNRKLSIKNVKEKTRKTGKTSTPKDKRNANRALKNNSMDISNIDDEHVKRRRAKKYAPVSTMAENTKNIVDIVGKHSQRTRTNNNNPVLIDNLNKNKQFTDSKNNENADGNMDLSIQLSLADATTKRSTDKKLKENRNKIVILSDIQLVPGNRAPQTKRSEEQYKSEVTEYISQKSNVEEPTMGHNPDPEKMWYIEGLMYQLAPSWTATALFNDKPVTIKSSDYIGKYLVLFFYPLDFCDHPYAQPPSEIFAIDNSYESFIELNTEVIGCSIDSYFTHRAWLNYDKNSNFKNLKFPLLADNNHKISKAYMMYSEKLGHSYRGFYIMDPEGIIFAIAVADLNVTIPLDEMFIRIRKHQERNSI